MSPPEVARLLPRHRTAVARADRVDEHEVGHIEHRELVLDQPVGRRRQVADIIELDAPWVGYDAPPVVRGSIDSFVDAVAARRIDRAFVLTSFHQSPLPLALLPAGFAGEQGETDQVQRCPCDVELRS